MSQPTTTHELHELGSDFTDLGFCNLYTYYAHDELFAVATPYESICGQETSNSAKEAVFMLEGTMYFGLIFLLIVMIRSTKRNRVDWYRLIAFYLIGTLGVPLSNEFGAGVAGFNRFIGFGVLVHNMAEAAILAVIWRGTQNKSSKGVRLMIVYFWIMLLVITYLPLHILLYVSSFQGATMDFFLVTSFCTVAVAFKEKGKFFWIAFSAALMHISSIQPLFLGMMLGWSALSAPTVIFLVPTFMLYIWFASSDPRATLTLSQQREDFEHSTRKLYDHEESIQKITEQVTNIMRQSTIGSQNGIQNGVVGGGVGGTGGADYGNFQKTKGSRRKLSNVTKPITPVIEAKDENKEDLDHINVDEAMAVLDNMEDTADQQNNQDKDKVSDAIPPEQNDDDNNNNNNTTENNKENNESVENDKFVVPVVETNNVGDFDMNPAQTTNEVQAYMRPHSASVSTAAAVAVALSLTDHGLGNTVDDGYGEDELKAEADAIGLIVERGLFGTKYFRHHARRAFIRALSFAILATVVLEVALIFSPCIIDTSFLCD